MNVSIDSVRDEYLKLQQNIVAQLTRIDGSTKFSKESIISPAGGLAQPQVLSYGAVIEKAAVQFTHTLGDSLPPAATERNPHLANRPFAAVSISVISHPRNPHMPSAHMNLRCFSVDADPPHWYFGGGFDLTPHILYPEDARFWHEQAKSATGDLYDELKQKCDEYFYLPHRSEMRGVGGVFFDDFQLGSFQDTLNFTCNIGRTFESAYAHICDKRKGVEWSAEEEAWLLYRRGRYAEFNLLYDRGTRYGLQSGRRIESVLASLPPRVVWSYQFNPTTSGVKQIHAELQSALQPQQWVS